MTVRRTAALVAAMIAAAVAAPASAQPETYTVDPTHTFPSFEISHLGFSTQRGRFNATSGKVVLDAAARTGSVEVTIDTNSIDTGLEALEKVLRSEEWFSVAQFPTMTFKGDRMRFDGDRLAGVDGTLTLRGVSRPVNLKVDNFRCGMHPLAKKPACGADASAVIRRSEFGMVKFPAPAVGEEVRIAIQIEAIRQ
jgi:polyisoprenoid-binding protein YceI